LINIFITALILILIFEFIIQFLVNIIKDDFQWLITQDDEFPEFKNKNINSFFRQSYNKKCGWLKKTLVIGYEKLKYRRTKFSTDKYGRRKSEYSNFKNKIEVYGDSYVFGRFVKDDQVWTEHVSKKVKFHIKNYGVGNYGFDQALLRYKYNKKDKGSKIVIIGFVPETLNRIQSVWKHYIEFGNIYGFKPRYIIENNKLKFFKNPISSKKDFKNLKKIKNKIDRYDKFYLKKFKKFQFRYPYTLSFFRNFKFNVQLFHAFIINSVSLNKIKKRKKLFPLYFKHNVRMANKLYNDYDSTFLFKKLIYKFVKLAKKRKNIPVLIVFPQKDDIDLYNKNKNLYGNFFNQIKKIKVINLTNFLSDKNLKKVYLDEDCGGHLSRYGNKLVADKISKEIKNVLFQSKSAF